MASPKGKLTPLSKLFFNLKAELKPVSGESRVNVENSVNRILSKDIFAKYDNPPFDNSAIDGFAINEESGLTSKNITLLEGLLRPGFKSNIKINEGIKILTGASIPAGTTRIIFKENTKEYNQKLHFVQDDDMQTNIRLRGEDFKKGDLLFKKNNLIRVTDLAALIGSGNSSIAIVKPLKVGLITTGNELNPSIKKQRKGFIFDTNSVPLKNLLEKWGYSVGRPFICARLGAKYVFGLPGNPVAAFICALIILRPSLGRLGGEKDWFKPFSFKAKANFKKYKRPGRTEFLRANLNRENGLVSIFPLEGSSRLSSLSWSNGIIELSEEEQNIDDGSPVDFIPYGSFFQ